jgi:hypothetical protein
MHRYVRCFISYITIAIVLETEYSFSLLPAHIQYINADYNYVHCYIHIFLSLPQNECSSRLLTITFLFLLDTLAY